MAEDSGKAADDPAPAGALEIATRIAQRHEDAIKAIRDRSERTAKLLAGIGSSAISAAGIAKVADVFPLSDENKWLSVLSLAALAAGFFLMIGAVLLLARAFWKLQTPFVTSSSLDTMQRVGPVSEADLKLTALAYDSTAQMNSARSLLAYEARGRRLRRLAERSEETLSTTLHARADLIAAEVRATQARAGMLVIRSRASRAVLSKASATRGAMFTVGFLAFGLSADFLDSSRPSSRVDRAKACIGVASEATKAKIALENLETGCSISVKAGDKPAEKTEKKAAATVNDELITLAENLATCRERAANEKDPAAAAAPCKRLAKALAALAESP